MVTNGIHMRLWFIGGNISERRIIMTRDKIKNMARLLDRLEQFESIYSIADKQRPILSINVSDSNLYLTQIKRFDSSYDRLLDWIKNEIEVELPKEIGLEMD